MGPGGWIQVRDWEQRATAPLRGDQCIIIKPALMSLLELLSEVVLSYRGR